MWPTSMPRRTLRDLERRDRPRPDDPVAVVALLDDRLQGPADADSVASHDKEVPLLLVVGVARVHPLLPFCAELEDLADLYAAPGLEGPAADGIGLARANAAEIPEASDLELARHVDVAKMEAAAVW